MIFIFIPSVYTHGETFRGVRNRELSTSAAEKLARFLLEFSDGRTENDGHIEYDFGLTHQEIAGMIGASRETVTRLLTNFRRKRLVEYHYSKLAFIHKTGLRALLKS